MTPATRADRAAPIARRRARGPRPLGGDRAARHHRAAAVGARRRTRPAEPARPGGARPSAPWRALPARRPRPGRGRSRGAAFPAHSLLGRRRRPSRCTTSTTRRARRPPSSTPRRSSPAAPPHHGPLTGAADAGQRGRYDRAVQFDRHGGVSGRLARRFRHRRRTRASPWSCFVRPAAASTLGTVVSRGAGARPRGRSRSVTSASAAASRCAPASPTGFRRWQCRRGRPAHRPVQPRRRGARRKTGARHGGCR